MRIHRIAAWHGMFVLAFVCSTGGATAAQGLSLPLPGTPRTTDGKPNLKAPAPRTTDGKPWLDNRGHPHTDALRTTERFRRIDFGRMELVVTVDDPKAYSRPWTSATIPFSLLPDTELLEHLCENNRDLEHPREPPSTGRR